MTEERDLYELVKAEAPRKTRRGPRTTKARRRAVVAPS
jgi:hypothetical protein